MEQGYKPFHDTGMFGRHNRHLFSAGRVYRRDDLAPKLTRINNRGWTTLFAM